MVKTYWWKTKPNFGDLLNAPLLAHFSGLEAVWASPADADLLCVGSNLQLLPPRWRGVIAGAGKLLDQSVDFSEARVLGVRGHLSAQGAPGTFVVGDPVLIVDELVQRQPPEFELGVVPHWSDIELAPRFAHLDPYVIDPWRDPIVVAEEISRCRKIVSSSLHGIVVADAYGIPRRIERFARMTHEGHDFKYLDYASAIGHPLTFGKLELVPRNRIEIIQGELFDMLRDLPGELS